MEKTSLLSRFSKGPDAADDIVVKLEAVQSRVGSLTERINVIEAGIQTDDAEKKDTAASEMKELREAMGGIEESLRSTIELLGSLRQGRASDEAEFAAIKERLEKVEKGLQAFL